MSDIVTAAKKKLNLGDDWKWCYLGKCHKSGNPIGPIHDANTGFSLVKLRQESTQAVVGVVMADAEWKDITPAPERAG